MSKTGESILIAALELPIDDRVKIACELLESVPENDPELEAEIERWEATLPDEKPVISMCLDRSVEVDDYEPKPLSDAGRKLLDAAFATSTLDRAIISRELLGTAPPPGWVEVTEEEMHAELRRRIEESERNPDDCISWEQLRDELRRDIDGFSASPELK